MQERKQPENLRLRALTPSITVNDIGKSLAWYRDVVGFIVEQEMQRDGVLGGAMMRAGGIRLMLDQDDFAKGRDRVKGVGFRMYFATAQDIDELASEIKSRGGILDQEPTDQPWGARVFALTDQDGFKISISTPMAGE